MPTNLSTKSQQKSYFQAKDDKLPTVTKYKTPSLLFQRISRGKIGRNGQNSAVDQPHEDLARLLPRQDLKKEPECGFDKKSTVQRFQNFSKVIAPTFVEENQIVKDNGSAILEDLTQKI